MKKLIIVFALAAILLVSSAVCVFGAEPIPIEFTKYGNGQYIYCNNPENINYWHLSTKENPDSTYMMKNEDLGPDNYSIFFCFYNCSDFDIEADVEIKGDAQITIDSVGFYVPQGKEYWDCLGAWSDLMGVNIRTIHYPREFVPNMAIRAEFPKTVNPGEDGIWLSEYIYNYDVIRPRTTFLMLVNFSIDEGSADVNFAALKHYGILGDRSNHNPDAAPGSYYKDTSVKGIDDETLPIVEANLDVVIDNDTKLGENLPVKITNQFHPDGNVTESWMTNINPARDLYLFSKNVAAGSDMLSLKYKDDTKLTYYGSAVPEEEKDNVWIFDLYHHDTQGYENGMPWKKDTHIPNAFSSEVLDLNNLPDVDWEFNLGNFGVTNRYHISVTNNTDSKKYLNYILDAMFASNVAIIRDKDGTMLNPYTLEPENAYGLSKGITWTKHEDCLLSIPVDPAETKKYILDLLLPTNCYGGMVNILRVDSYSYMTDVPKTDFASGYDKQLPKDMFFNGHEYMKWENGNLYEYINDNWQQIILPASAREIFDFNKDNYRIIKTADGYAARFSGWDEYDDYIAIQNTRNKLYLFDKSFNLTSTHTLGGYVWDMYSEGNVIYIDADKRYAVIDGELYEGIGETTPLSVSNGKWIAKYVNGGVKIYTPVKANVHYESNTPNSILSAGDMFYQIKSWKESYTETCDNVISLSYDGIYWTDFTLPDRYLELLSVLHFDGKTYVYCKNETIVLEDENAAEAPIYVMLDGEILSFDTEAETKNGRTMIPMRLFFEKLGAEVVWLEQSQQIVVSHEGRLIIFRIEDEKAYVDGEEHILDAPAYIKDDKTLIPLRFLSESLGYKVEWDAENAIASVYTR